MMVKGRSGMRRFVGAIVVVNSSRQCERGRGAEVGIVGVNVALSRFVANVSTRMREEDRERVKTVTAGHNALLQVKRTPRQAMRGVSVRGERQAKQA